MTINDTNGINQPSASPINRLWRTARIRIPVSVGESSSACEWRTICTRTSTSGVLQLRTSISKDWLTEGPLLRFAKNVNSDSWQFPYSPGTYRLVTIC